MPNHHQANSVAERSVGTVKALWKKTKEEGKCPYTALWMYRITPLSSSMPSPYELLYGRKPRSFLPATKKPLLSQHPESDNHQEANKISQERQKHFYDRHTGPDKEVMDNMDPVYVRNTLSNTWEPGMILNRPNPTREPRTYLVNIRGKVYQRTREHLKPRPAQKPADSDQGKPILQHEIPVFSTLPVPLSQKSLALPQSTPAATQKPTITPSPAPAKKPPDSPSPGFQLQSQTTRSGRATHVPARFKD